VPESAARLRRLATRGLWHGAGVRPAAESVLHRGRVFDVARASITLPSGLAQTYDVVLHAGAAAIAALDESGRLLCVRQYRIPAGDWLVEVPAGRLEPGEDPLVAAQRELEEETGFRAERWSLLRRFFPAVGFCTEVMHLYLAQGLVPAGDTRRAMDDDEELEVVFKDPAELLATDLGDAKTMIAAALVLGLR